MATVICPNCGGENNVTKRGGQECEYCGTMLQYPQAKKKSSVKKNADENNAVFPHGEYIIGISEKYSTKEKVEDELRKFLISNDNVPVDVFDYLEIKQVNWLYLPFIRYSGHVETEWSCNQIIEKEREVGEHPVRDRNGNIKYWEKEYETYYDYIPKSGRGSGSYDVLIPCGKGVELTQGLKECYGRIRFSSISIGNKRDWPCKEIFPQNAKVDTDFIDLNDNKSDIIGIVARVVKEVAVDCSFGNFGKITDEDMTYRQNLNLNTGILYYVSFVQVVYSYKGDTHEWVFMQYPSVRTAEPTMPEMDVLDNPLEEMQTLFEKQRKSLSNKETWSLILSFFFTTLIGCIIFYCRTNSVIEKAKRRLNTQVGLAALMFKLKRQENLAKYGVKVEIDHNNRDYIDDNDLNSDESLYDWSDKPTTVAGIEEYFAETEKIRKKALRKIRGFWWGLLTIILLIGGGTLGYVLYNNWQSEKFNAEQNAIQEAEDNRLINEITQRFNTEIVGNKYEGESAGFETDRLMKIHILDDSRLQYQVGRIGEFNYDGNTLSRERKWESPKTVNYTLSVEPVYDGKTRIGCHIKFDGYCSNNLLKDNDVEEFDEVIIVPLKDSEKTYSNLDTDYRLRKQ